MRHHGQKIKAIIFDYGKVICLPPDDGVMDEIAALAGVSRERFEPLYLKHRGDYDRGKFAVFDFYRNVISELNIKMDEEKISKMGALDLNSWKRINPETIKLMEEIKKAGFILGILSNMPFDFLEYCRKNIPVIRLPDVGIFSCEIGLIKPEKAIYQKLLSTIGCRAEELVFFDDVPENVNKALELGIEARVWQDSNKARQDLVELSIQL
jgi:putative hydrolase of the HAD superfamily